MEVESYISIIMMVMKMNREIEFRAWLKYKKEMVGVTTIDFKKRCVFIDKPYFPKIPEFYGTALLFDQIELMQYTGLKDKNGVKIFEGDIVKTPTRKGKIQFIWSGWYFHTDKDGFVELHDVTDIIEVIGNIYENKELLNENN